MSKIAFVFPGQGAQSVGMGKDLYDNFPEARQVIDQFSEWGLSDLRQITFEGPEETLKRTLYTQPAILSVSLAALKAFQANSTFQPVLTAGHSLGEYAALYTAGAFDLETAARLIQKRAELMENAPSGAMAAILGLPEGQIEQAIDELQNKVQGVVAVANYNTPEQVIISGHPAAVETACETLKSLGASKVIPLQVGGAFHSPLMSEASEKFGGYVKSFNFQNANIPVITNIDAQLTTEGSQFAHKLQSQIQGSVRWSETMRVMQAQGIDTYIEFGPGKVLTGMIKRFDRSAKVFNVFDKDSLLKTIEAVEERVPA